MVSSVTTTSVFIAVFVLWGYRGSEYNVELVLYAEEKNKNKTFKYCAETSFASTPFKFCSKDYEKPAHSSDHNELLVYTLTKDKLEQSYSPINKILPSNYFSKESISSETKWLRSIKDPSGITQLVYFNIVETQNPDGISNPWRFVRPVSIRAQKIDGHFRTSVYIRYDYSGKISFTISKSDHMPAFIVNGEIKVIEKTNEIPIIKVQESLQVQALKGLDKYGNLKMVDLENFNLKDCKEGCLMVITTKQKSLGAIGFYLANDKKSIELKLITPDLLKVSKDPETSIDTFLKIWAYTFIDGDFMNSTKDPNKSQLTFIANSDIKQYSPDKEQKFVCLRMIKFKDILKITDEELQRFIIGGAIFDIEKEVIDQLENDIKSFERLVCQSSDSWYYLIIQKEFLFRQNNDMFVHLKTESIEALIRI